MTAEKFKRKLAAILSADVKGYSRLMGEDDVTSGTVGLFLNVWEKGGERDSRLFRGRTKEKVLEFKWMGSKNGCFLALNRYFDRQNCRHKNRHSLSEKPLQVPSPAAGKPQKELLLMASMGDVPHEARNVWPTRSGHPSTPP